MLADLINHLRPLLHPLLIHFPIALLYASVALDWIGFGFKQPNLTRAGFYTLVLGALGAGVAALTGPDHAAKDAEVAGLLAAHQNMATLTVVVAVTLVAIRFFAIDGLRSRSALALPI